MAGGDRGMGKEHWRVSGNEAQSRTLTCVPKWPWNLHGRGKEIPSLRWRSCQPAQFIKPLEENQRHQRWETGNRWRNHSLPRCHLHAPMLIPSFVDSTHSDPILTKICLPKMFAPAMLRAVFVREDSAIKHRQGIAVWHSHGLGLNCCDTCGGLSRSKIWSIGQTNFGRGRGKRRRTRQDASGFLWETRTLSVDCPTIYKYPAMASGLPTDGGPVGEGGVRVDVRPIGNSLILSWLSWSRQDARICDCAFLFLLDTQMPA